MSHSVSWNFLTVARALLVVVEQPADGLRLHVVPILAQRLDDGRHDQAFDIGARGVVGAELGALALGKGLLEQRPEDRRLDCAPIADRGDLEQRQFILGDLDRDRLAKQAAVERLDVFLDGRRIAALVHGLEEIDGGQMEAVRLALVLPDQFEERAVREQSDVLGEHGEDAAHEELGDLVRPFGLELRLLRRRPALHALRHLGQQRGDLLRDLGCVFRRIERERIVHTRLSRSRVSGDRRSDMAMRKLLRSGNWA